MDITKILAFFIKYSTPNIIIIKQNNWIIKITLINFTINFIIFNKKLKNQIIIQYCNFTKNKKNLKIKDTLKKIGLKLIY